ncbi:MAG TPA: chromosomal replication initiator protein DnaA [Dehalococcoidia bacterium]|nr:chromosomal replication initiator protein DnaA [Dehalococcoidia bacterium]
MRSAQEIWEAALGELQLQINKPNYQTWFQGTRGAAYQDGQFVISVPSAFVAEYLDKNQRSLIEKTLIGLIHDSNIHVHFQTGSARYGSTGKDSPRDYQSPPGLPAFNPRYTFDSFIIGDSNQLACAAAKKVAQNPGGCYNPLFIFGGAGLGKTHLLQAIGHAACSNNTRVLYVSGEHFTNDFVDAIRQHRTDEFRSKYRDIDILMIDDVQFISGKEQTAESFFHTFNELHNNNRQIVVTSDRPPKSMPLLEGRLRSRFEWGLIVDVKPPDIKTRLEILKAKSKQSGAEILPDVLDVIARQVKENIRELEGGLNRIIAYARLLQAEVTPEVAAKALADIGGGAPPERQITSVALLDAVAECFQITPELISGRRRDKQVAMARQVAMYLLKQQDGYSLAEIGSLLGGRNPSTVSHACEKVAEDIEASPVLKRKVKYIQKKLRSR